MGQPGKTGNDFSARVIAGRKGSGKTVYLRRLFTHASQEDSLFADVIHDQPPETTTVVQFCQWFSPTILTDKWTLLWLRAIARSLVSLITTQSSFRASVPLETADALYAYYKPILRRSRGPLSPYSQVTEIINGCHTEHQMDMFLQHPRWAELEVELADLVRTCPPIFLFLDSIDEQFEHAPMYWLRCQLGLFYAVMRLLRDQRLGARVHLTVTIRDVVMSRVYRSEHATRYRGEPHIRVLDWNRDASRFFLHRKLERLEPDLLCEPFSDATPVERWLGLASMHHQIAGLHEPSESYILRHTRLLPRDIVIIGNMISSVMGNIRAASSAAKRARIVQHTVSQAAKMFGNEQLQICGNQIVSDLMPTNAATRGFSETFTGSAEYAQTVADQLKLVIRMIGKDRFLEPELESGKHMAAELLGHDVDVFDVLWQNGLVGYEATNGGAAKKAVFFSERSMEDFKLPRQRGCYVFHPCLLDSAELEAVGPRPVMPF